MNPAEQKPSESVTLAAKGGGRGGNGLVSTSYHNENISFDF